jgi:hypothetical protein
LDKNKKLKKEELLCLEKNQILSEDDIKEAYIKTDFICDVSAIIAKTSKEHEDIKPYTIKDAVADEEVAPLLRKMVTKHHPEWLPFDKDEKIKKRLEESPYYWPKDKYEAYWELAFEKLAFWHLLKEKTKINQGDSWISKENSVLEEKFPNEVYFFHAIAFIDHVNKLAPLISLKEAQEIALKVTSVFEGSWNVSTKDFKYEMCAANFDLAGVSFGIIQWNIGTGTLWPMFKKMYDKDSTKFKECYEHNEGSERGQIFF